MFCYMILQGLSFGFQVILMGLQPMKRSSGFDNYQDYLTEV
jgi:hypothetical protein